MLRQPRSRRVRRALIRWQSMLLGSSVLVTAALPSIAETVQLPEIVTTATQPRRTARPLPPQPPAQPPQDPAPSAAAGGERSAPSSSASEQIVDGNRVGAQPHARPGDVLETVAGLIVTQHSGEGKANQYFLRGFNLDHGTDLAIWVDGMPVNMRSHGHGQGYADISFLIPELISYMRIRKGPYFADEGDFSSAGAVHIDYINSMNPGLAQGTLGMFGYGRTLAIKSYPLWAGNLLIAGEGTVYDGPWSVPDRMRKVNGVIRYSQGTDLDGFTIAGMAYNNRWTSTDQLAQRAIDRGIVDRLGTLDPTDGGRSSRYSLSTRLSVSNDWGVSRLNAYAIRSNLQLFNNFTYFLDDEVNGDQFNQSDARTVLGFHASHTFKGRLGPFDSETKVGVQARHDSIDVGLRKTLARQALSTVRVDAVQEGSTALYVQNSTRWLPWLRTIVGGRGDWYQARVTSDNPLNSGGARAFIASPKFSLVLGPAYRTELFVNTGHGFHSNDARGVTITVDPNTGLPAERVPLLVRSKGAEVGARTTLVPGLKSSLALFVLDYASELLFVGDAGTTEASRPSRRVGIEWTSAYKPVPCLSFDLDVAVTRARFTDFEPAGNRVPGAPNMVIAGGVTLGDATGWFGAVKLRYFGPRPLIEDASVQSTPTTLVNARAGYRFRNGLRVQFDALNLFNAKANQVEYYYESRLSSEPSGIATFDRHLHPVEPLAVRVTLAGPL